MDAETLELIDRRIKEAVEKAIKNERQRLGTILRSSSVEMTWDYDVGSRPSYDLTVSAIAKEIEKDD